MQVNREWNQQHKAGGGGERGQVLLEDGGHGDRGLPAILSE